MAKKQNLALRLLTEKCPNCGKGHIFEQRRKIFEIPRMRERCAECNYLFDREPGYFLGAMYISYGLAVFQAIIAFLICYFFFPELPTLLVCFILVAVILLFSVRNFRLSRVMYMYIFPN